jgi:curli biogenesis system outer membrane secretion channel CsgG
MNARNRRAARVATLVLTLFALSCASSAQRIYVNPAADMAFYKKVAVLPFMNMSGDGLAGQRVTRAFITELIMTDRYQIVQPEEYRNALSKISGLPGPDGTYDPEKLKEAAAQVGATGIVRGAVTEYQMQRSGGGGDVPILAFDVELIDVNTGDVAWRSSITRRGKGRLPLVGGGAAHTMGRLTQMACEELVAQLKREAL